MPRMVASRVSLPAQEQRVDDRYSLDEVIGRGGTAEVYRARDEKTGQVVALKRALPAAPALAARRRLLLEREYYTLAQLAHPRIIEVYAYGIDEAGAYYTMELLAGEDFATPRKLAWQDACALLLDVASSLAILHSRGLLHRDVSARNVRRGRDGRVKLLDFGALSSMGTSLEVAGTPPYVPPEALQMQVLDARADLFALGALAYYLLAGRHAYGARKLAELRDMWRSAPQPLSRVTPEVPAALSALTMQLLSLDRMARPPSAAEVMRRLCVISGLPIETDIAVSRAYLTMPGLVGREALQVASRRALLRLTQAQGGALLIEGAAGSGRTRALDACVLDGRLLGAQVVRADASLGAAGDWAVARTLCSQLVELLPQQANAVLRPLTPWLGPFLPVLRGETAPRSSWPERNALIRGLRDFVLGLAERERLLLAVDDVDRIDEPSLAFLAALCGHADTRSVVLALTVDSASRTSSDKSLSLLYARAQVLELAPLTAAQTKTLLAPVFGDLPIVQSLSERVYALAQGNPRDTMELAEHLVERGLARYEAGSWSLPPEISESDMPHSMASSLLSRVQSLSADARSVAELMAVTEQPGLSSEQFELLCPEWERSRLYAALQELVTARLLLSAADHYAFYMRGLSQVLRDAMSDESAREAHRRWADMLTQTGADALVRAQHMLEAGRMVEATSLLLSLDLRARYPNVPLIERALRYAGEQGLPARQQRELRLGLLTSTVVALDVTRFTHWAPLALVDLERESGLVAYRELQNVPDPERLMRALNLTQDRRLALPEDERGFDIAEAISRLLRLSNGYAVMAIWTVDAELLQGFPSLKPLASLSPVVGLMQDLLSATEHWVCGRVELALDMFLLLLARITREVPEGIDAEQHRGLCNLFHVLLGMLKASNGIDAEHHAKQLETDATMRASAWRIRQLYQLTQGNALEASSCGRRVDLLKLQQSVELIGAGGVEVVELWSAIRVGDLMSLGAALELVRTAADRYRGWLPVLALGESAYAALQADWPAALAHAEHGLAVAAGRHACCVMLAAARVDALRGLGRVNEAVAEGHRYTRHFVSTLQQPALDLAAAYAYALSAAGRYAEAFSQLEAAAADAARLAVTGHTLGYVFETAAYVALEARDTPRFEVAFAACALEYKRGHNPHLGARLSRLFDAAQSERLRVIQLAGLLDEAGLHIALGVEQSLLRDRFGECIDRLDRAHCALSLMLSQGERASGFWFAASPRGLVLLGGIPSDSPPPELQRWVQTWFEHLPAALFEEQPVTETLDVSTEVETSVQPGVLSNDGDTGMPARLLASDGREFEPLLLGESDRPPLGVFVLEVGRGTRLMPTRALLGEIASALLRHGDVLGK